MSPRRQPTELEQLVAAQAQLTQVMTQFMANQNNNNGNNQPQGDALTRFLRLRPAKFSTATEPMVALYWLRSVNKDLVTVGCTNAKKVRFAAHLLEGPAASWWDTFQITHPLDTVTWAMFEKGFRTNHVSSGDLSLKRKEFRNLRQTNRTVAEYIEEFNNLSRYAPEDVDTDAKRRERFLDGLSESFQYSYLWFIAPLSRSLWTRPGSWKGSTSRWRTARERAILTTLVHTTSLALHMMDTPSMEGVTMGAMIATTMEAMGMQIHPTVNMGGMMKMGTLWLPRATGTTCRPVGGT